VRPVGQFFSFILVGLTGEVRAAHFDHLLALTDLPLEI